MNRVVSSKQKQQGFTIIELTVAMAFVSILMLSIAVTTIQIGNIYNKGLTMRSVDYAGRALSLDIRQTLGQSEPFDVDTARKFQKHPDSSVDNPDGGRFCTGIYSYIWNFGKSMKKPINLYTVADGGASAGEIRFVKIRDTGGVYCADLERDIPKNEAFELLSGGDRDLAVQSFEVKKLADDPLNNQALYRIVMEIGTNSQDALFQPDELNTLNNECRAPSDAAAMENFCAVNQFDFTVQAGNKGDV